MRDENEKRSWSSEYPQRRGWVSEYPMHVRDRDVELDKVETIVETHAERLEKTVQCVAFVKRKKGSVSGLMKPKVVLRVFFPRHVDEQLVDNAVNRVDVDIIEAIYDEANSGDDGAV